MAGIAPATENRRQRPRKASTATTPGWRNAIAGRLRPGPVLLGLLSVALVTGAGQIAPRYITNTHAAVMYMLAVFVIAIRYGLWPAMITAVASVAAFDFFFLPPVYSFLVNTPQDALLLVFLAIVAVTASSLASRLREQMLIARRHAEANAELYRFAGKLAATVTTETALAEAAQQVHNMLGYRARVQLGAEAAALPRELALPVRAAGQTIGVMAVMPPAGTSPSPEDLRLLDALVELTGIAVGRQLLADRLAQLGIEQEADRLRSALLNSIAHDLTAPISSIASVLASLAGSYDTFDETARRELIAEAEREADRLHRFSENLVHMTRLESGALSLCRERVDLGELVGSALNRARPVLAARRIVVDIPSNLPALDIDFVLIEQAVFNILENIGKYTPAEATVTITADPAGAAIALRIGDNGPGFSAEDLERIFTKFYRGKASAGTTTGTGLGLAICRGFVEAHGGTVTAANRPGETGAIFTMMLPKAPG